MRIRSRDRVAEPFDRTAERATGVQIARLRRRQPLTESRKTVAHGLLDGAGRGFIVLAALVDSLLDALHGIAQLAKILSLHLVALQRGEPFGHRHANGFDIRVPLDRFGRHRLDEA